MRTGKQKLIIAAKVLAVLFVALIIAFYLFRDAVLKQTIAKVSNTMEIDYNSTFSVKKASFDGFTGVNLTDVVFGTKKCRHTF